MHVLHLVEYIALAVMILLLLLVLFEPPLRYKVKAPSVPLDSEDYLRLVAALAKSRAEIETIVTKHGATGYVSGWQGNLVKVMFEMRGRRLRFPGDGPRASRPARCSKHPIKIILGLRCWCCRA